MLAAAVGRLGPEVQLGLQALAALVAAVALAVAAAMVASGVAG